MNIKKAFTQMAMMLLLCAGVTAQPALQISRITGQSGTYAPRAQVTFTFTVNNAANLENVPNLPDNANDADRANRFNIIARNRTRDATGISFVGNMVGTDIYGNITTIPVSLTSSAGRIDAGDNATYTGVVTIPADGTLHNTTSTAYSIVGELTWQHLAIDQAATASTPATFTTVSAGPASLSSASDLQVNVPMNLQVVGLSYPPGTYRAGDIIQVTAFVRNQTPAGSTLLIRPLRPTSADDFRTEIYLSDDASIDSGNDFLLNFYSNLGDLTSTVDGLSEVRLVRVSDTPPLISTFGRSYQPQSDDGFLDINETSVVSIEVLIPSNFAGTYFVGAYTDALGEITEIQEDVDASFGNQGDNIFVQDLTPQLRIASSLTPDTLPVSELTDESGGQLAESDGSSDVPSVSDDGNWIAFESTASNLDPNNPGDGNYHIYLRNRSTADIDLISISNAGVVGNRDSRNPVISADGRYVAFESLATNLLTGNQVIGSHIYTYDRLLRRLDIVSINDEGLISNGSCYSPSISGDGRLIAFETLATNLDVDFSSQLSSTFAVQVFVHDRDVSGSGVFGVEGNVDTHFVSHFGNQPADEDALAPKISYDGRVIAYVSRASNLGATNAGFISQVWSQELGADAVPINTPNLVSINHSGTAGNGDSSEVAINGGPTENPYGLQIAFSSKSTDLLAPGEDTNDVADIFVRDYTNPVSPVTARISVSNPRVAHGTIQFFGLFNLDNTVLNQPLFGETITLDDGVNPAVTLTFGVDVVIGLDTGMTRDNLVDAINATSNLNMVAYASNPPTDFFNTLLLSGYFPQITIFNTIPGVQGNQPILTTSFNVFSLGLAGGGTESVDVFDADITNPFAIAQGSLQPSMDRSGRIVAFRSLSENLSVILDGNRFRQLPTQPDFTTPKVGEMIRNLLRGNSNVYYRDRDLDGSGALDQVDNTKTTRASVNKFGYPTNQLLNIADSASSRMPAVSGNGRFIAFATDATNSGGLRFDRSNTQPLDSNNLRDIFVYDRNVVVPTVPNDENPPFITLTNPTDGSSVSITSPLIVNAGAIGYSTSTGEFSEQEITSVRFFVNGVEAANVTTAPFSTQITPSAEGNMRIFAIATDSRGLQTASQAIDVDAVVVTLNKPTLEMVLPVLSNQDFSIGDTVSLQADVLSTATSNLFLTQFSFVQFDFYVNGVSVFTSTEQLDSYSLDYELDISGDVDISAGIVYSGVVTENVFSSLVQLNVRDFDPVANDKDFITDSFIRLFGRVPTNNESSEGEAQLDGTVDSRANYVVSLLSSNVAETSELALLIYRTMTGEWPDGDELEQALDDLLSGGTGITDINALTTALVPEYEIRFSALNTELGFVRQLFTNKHGVAPSALSEVRLFNSAIGEDQLLGVSQVIPGYLGDTLSYATQFALDNEISGFQGPSGLPLSNIHLYAMPNDATAKLKIALLLAAYLGEDPTDQLVDSFSGIPLVEAVEQILLQYMGTSSTALPAAVSSAAEVSPNWYYLDWIGSFAHSGISGDDWIYSSDLGWLYIAPSSTSSGVYLYSSVMGTWLYGSSSLNHFFYHYDDQTWVFVHRGTSPGSAVLFYNTYTWLQVNR